MDHIVESGWQIAQGCQALGHRVNTPARMPDWMQSWFSWTGHANSMKCESNGCLGHATVLTLCGEESPMEGAGVSVLIPMDLYRETGVFKRLVALSPEEARELILKAQGERKFHEVPRRHVATPALDRMTHLHRLDLVACHLEKLPPLPAALRWLNLTRCTGTIGFTEANLKGVERLEIIDWMAGKFCISIKGGDPALKTLRVVNRSPNAKRPDNNWFDQLPATLETFELERADITAETIEQLPKTLRNLRVQECPSNSVTSVRAQLLFPHCSLTVFDHVKKERMDDQLLKMLEERVMGQPQALQEVLKLACSIRVGMVPKDRPASVMLFAGPSGVGKTELARALADVLDFEFYRFDMGEYRTELSGNRLIGADPGYVGAEAGHLTNQLEKNTEAVVLFDEIEKAHPSVLKLLLGTFDAGRITYYKKNGLNAMEAKELDCTPTVFIMTSNWGAQEVAAIYSKDGLSDEGAFDKARDAIEATIRGEVSPEFLGRIDAAIPFRPLSEIAIATILQSKIERYQKAIAHSHGIEVVLDESTWSEDVKNIDPATGARRLIRKLEKEMNGFIAAGLINSTIKKGDRLHIERAGNGSLRFRLQGN